MRNKICSLPGLIKESLATSVYTLKMKKRRAFVVMSITVYLSCFGWTINYSLDHQQCTAWTDLLGVV